MKHKYMKAIVWKKYGSPDYLELADIEKPVPKDDEVLIKVHAATVTPGDCEVRRFDMHVLFWIPLRIYFGIFKPRRPILGMELSGEIEAIGQKVKNFNVGDRIVCGTSLGFGAHAEYKCLKSNAMIALKPSNMTYEEAASLPTGGTNALHYLRKGKIQPGEKVLINGAAGCFGTYAIQLAKHFGAEVTCVDSTDKLQPLTTLGADHLIDYTKENFAESGKKYDVIFDVVGKSVRQGMKALTPKGRYILATPWVYQVIQGFWCSLMSKKKFIIELAKEDPKDLVYLKQLVEEGKLKTVIDKTFPLAEVAAAHHYVEKGDKVGQVIIKITDQ